MYGSEEEVVRTHHGDELRSFRKVFLHPLHLGGNFFIDSGRIGTRRLEHHARNARMTVHSTVISIAILSQLYLGDVFQLQDLTIVRRTNDNISKFFRSDQTSFIFHCILIGFVRVFTE